jgi:hypothetical protein
MISTVAGLDGYEVSMNNRTGNFQRIANKTIDLGNTPKREHLRETFCPVAVSPD